MTIKPHSTDLLYCDSVREQQVKVLFVISETIRDLGEVPSGHLYAHVQSVMSLDAYNSIIDELKRAGLVKEQFHKLIWIGPEGGENGGK